MFLNQIFHFRDVVSPGSLKIPLKTPGITNMRRVTQITLTITLLRKCQYCTKLVKGNSKKSFQKNRYSVKCLMN